MSSWASTSPAELGRRGEWFAAWWLRLHGYRILHRNVRVGGVEVDIVAARGRTLVVCEVKTRRNARFGTAAEAVDAHKERRLVHAGELLLQRHRVRDRSVLCSRECVGVDLAARKRGARIQQAVRPQQAADMLGAKRRCGGRHASLPENVVRRSDQTALAKSSGVQFARI